jgi:protein-S-isoprenylcysteine O-methyltransferase Ste14
MSRIARILASPLSHVASGMIMATAYGFFVVAHVIQFANTGRVPLLLFILSETLVAIFFLVRTQPKSFTTSPLEWVVAVLGSFAGLFLRPTSTAFFPGADWGVAVGTVLQIAAVMSLNRSYAVVPALRELKTGGMYRWIRHPLYASYLITFTFYLAGNASVTNGVVYLVTVSLLFARLHMEEAHLSRDPTYRQYRHLVRWRVIPGVY